MSKISVVEKSAQPLALYIHWPFCVSKCPYCDFNSHVSERIDQSSYLNGYIAELSYNSSYLQNKKITSIFFGGGTPSLMEPYVVERIISYLKGLNVLSDNLEITLEMNPESINDDKSRAFREAGINRASIGVQSLINKDLNFLGRPHSAEIAIKAVESVRRHFHNYSLDIIYARPDQNIDSWLDELSLIKNIAGNHLSLYQLTIEPGTKFYNMHKAGALIEIAPNKATQLYNATIELLKDWGLSLYEISNFAASGYECRHNICYWKYGEYLGIGPGAHSRKHIDNGIYAVSNYYNPEIWLKKVMKNEHVQHFNKLTDEEVLTEIIMMGLRLSGGIKDERIVEYCGKTWLDVIDIEKISYLVKKHIVVIKNDLMYLTNRGLLLHNAVCSSVISALKI